MSNESKEFLQHVKNKSIEVDTHINKALVHLNVGSECLRSLNDKQLDVDFAELPWMLREQTT